MASGAYRSGTAFVERPVDNLHGGLLRVAAVSVSLPDRQKASLMSNGREVPRYPIGSGFEMHCTIPGAHVLSQRVAGLGEVPLSSGDAEFDSATTTTRSATSAGSR